MKTNYPICSVLFHKTSALWSIAPEATVFEAIKLMAEKNIGALLVMSAGKLAGVFTERDYTRKIALQGKTSRDTRVWEIIPKEIITVTPDDSVEECMKLMTENRVRHLPGRGGHQRRRHRLHRRPRELDHLHAERALEQMEQYIAGSVAT